MSIYVYAHCCLCSLEIKADNNRQNQEHLQSHLLSEKNNNPESEDN